MAAVKDSIVDCHAIQVYAVFLDFLFGDVVLHDAACRRGADRFLSGDVPVLQRALGVLLLKQEGSSTEGPFQTFHVIHAALTAALGLCGMRRSIIAAPEILLQGQGLMEQVVTAIKGSMGQHPHAQRTAEELLSHLQLVVSGGGFNTDSVQRLITLLGNLVAVYLLSVSKEVAIAYMKEHHDAAAHSMEQGLLLQVVSTIGDGLSKPFASRGHAKEEHVEDPNEATALEVRPLDESFSPKPLILREKHTKRKNEVTTSAPENNSFADEVQRLFLNAEGTTPAEKRVDRIIDTWSVASQQQQQAAAARDVAASQKSQVGKKRILLPLADVSGLDVVAVAEVVPIMAAVDMSVIASSSPSSSLVLLEPTPLASKKRVYYVDIHGKCFRRIEVKPFFDRDTILL